MLNKNTVWKLKLAPKELGLLQGIPLRKPEIDESVLADGNILRGVGEGSKSGKVTGVEPEMPSPIYKSPKHDDDNVLRKSPTKT